MSDITETTNLVETAEQSTPPEFRKLSETIRELEPKKHLGYIRSFKRAIKEGIIQALPIELDFHIGDKVFGDFMVAVTPEYTAWHTGMLKKASLGRRRHGVTYSDDILAGKVDFAKEAEEYRKLLQNRSRRRKRQVQKSKQAMSGVESKTTEESEQTEVYEEARE